MNTPIQLTNTAIREGTVAQVKALLAKHPELLTEEPLMMLINAAENNRVDMLPILVDAGVDVNAVERSFTGLGCAAAEGAIEAAAWLLDHGARVDERNSPDEMTPLLAAARQGRLEMVKLLMERGANPNLTYGENIKRSTLAVAKDLAEHAEMVAYLQSNGARYVSFSPEPDDVESPAFQAKAILYPAEWFDKKWRHVNDFANLHGLDAMCEKNQVFFLIGCLIQELAQGGALMLYYNPSGQYAPQMAEALHKIGDPGAGAVMRALNGLFPGGAPASDHEAREKQLKDLPPKAQGLGGMLEQFFNQSPPEGGERLWLGQLYNYYFA